MKKNFVTFHSAGSFVAETTTKEIDSWNVDVAKKMAEDITERYGAKPYGFNFITKSRDDNDLDSKVSDSSGMYYINCRMLTLEDVEKEKGKSSILYSNMECNGWNRVVTTKVGWGWTQPLGDKDIVLY